jgi:hypothetical protein
LFVRCRTTQLEVVSGAVDLSRKGDAERVTVRSDQYALAGADRLIGYKPFDEAMVIGFTLIDASKREPIVGHDAIVDGAVLDPAALPTREFTIVAHTAPADVGSVGLDLWREDQKIHSISEFRRPYALRGDEGDVIKPWAPGAGTYRLTATPFSERDRKGQAGTPLTVRFRVVDGD